MIDRRTLLKSASALALPAPGLLAGQPAPVRAVAKAGKADDARILKLRFRVGYDTEGEYPRVQYFTHVWILPPGLWEALPESQRPKAADPDEPDDLDWSAQFLDDGRVVAVRLEIKDGFERKSYPRDEPCPESVAALRRIRSTIIGALEDDDRVTSIAVFCGGNGDASLHVGVRDEVERKGRHIDQEFYVRLSSEED